MHHCPQLPSTSGLLVLFPTVNLFLLPYLWTSNFLTLRLTALQWSMNNGFAHYIVQRGTYKSEERRNNTHRLIISTPTGRAESPVKTIYLELNSVRISTLVYSCYFYSFTGKSTLCVEVPARSTLLSCPFCSGYERRQGDGEQFGRNWGFIQSIIERAVQ